MPRVARNASPSESRPTRVASVALAMGVEQAGQDTGLQLQHLLHRNIATIVSTSRL
jgi:hypothetical protein